MAKKKDKWIVRKSNVARRNNDIIERFDHLYDVKRMRYDDCIAKLAYEFYMSETTVLTILRDR